MVCPILLSREIKVDFMLCCNRGSGRRGSCHTSVSRVMIGSDGYAHVRQCWLLALEMSAARVGLIFWRNVLLSLVELKFGEASMCSQLVVIIARSIGRQGWRFGAGRRIVSLLANYQNGDAERSCNGRTAESNSDCERNDRGLRVVGSLRIGMVSRCKCDGYDSSSVGRHWWWKRAAGYAYRSGRVTFRTGNSWTWGSCRI